MGRRYVFILLEGGVEELCRALRGTGGLEPCRMLFALALPYKQARLQFNRSLAHLRANLPTATHNFLLCQLNLAPQAPPNATTRRLSLRLAAFSRIIPHLCRISPASPP
eukprot:5739629-Pleurochrysis_carterae.AAC.1